MKMKQRETEKKQLNDFLFNVINLHHFTVQLSPLLTVDSVSIPTLKEIYIDSKEDRSSNGKRLKQSSYKLLKVHDKIKKQFGHRSFLTDNNIIADHHKLQLKPNPSILLTQIAKQKQPKIKKHFKNIKIPVEMQDQIILNNENINTLNKMQQTKSKPKAIDVQLKQILRPQYKRKFTERSYFYQNQGHELNQERKQFQYANDSFNQRYLTEYEEYQDIPIIKNKTIKNKVHSNSKRNRSISPKIQNRKKNDIYNSISSISQNKIINTDISFEIDLHHMGFVAKCPQQRDNRLALPKSTSKVLDLFVGNKKHYQKKPKTQQSNTFSVNNPSKMMQKVQNGSINEQQPWECDQQEIEEELRHINEQLSHRNNNKIQKNTQNVKFQQLDNQNSHRLNKKQTKTVRLSLTPMKSKNKDNKNRRKNEFHQIQIVRTPIRNKSQNDHKQSAQIVKPKSPLNNQYREYSPLQIECAKWNKSSKGLISLEIKRLANIK